MADNTQFLGVRRIAKQRARHLQLGFTAEHDDLYTRNQLVRAALAYLEGRKTYWPFGPETFHCALPNAFAYGPPSLGMKDDWTPDLIDARIRDLERGASFVAAEIDRLARLKATLTGRDKRGPDDGIDNDPDDDDDADGHEGDSGARVPPPAPAPPAWARELLPADDDFERAVSAVSVSTVEAQRAAEIEREVIGVRHALSPLARYGVQLHVTPGARDDATLCGIAIGGNDDGK